MNRLVVSMALICTATVADAQSRSFEFKGIKPTDTVEAHRADFEKCRKYYLAQGCSPKDIRVGNVIMFNYVVLFPDNGSGVSQIRGDFRSYDYDTILSAFTMKWGNPDSTKITAIQNGFGATLQVPIAQWDFAEGTMILRGGDFRGFGHMQFVSRAERARLDALEGPTVDF
jgi:hypothetical protein